LKAALLKSLNYKTNLRTCRVLPFTARLFCFETDESGNFLLSGNGAVTIAIFVWFTALARTAPASRLDFVGASLFGTWTSGW
jgi:hypothetical protein